MPTNITDVNAFTSPIVAPSDGDDLTAASIAAAGGVGLQGLSDRARYLLSTEVADTIALQNRALALENRIVNGEMQGPMYAYCTNGINIVIGSILSLNINGVHFGEQVEFTVNTLGLTADTWYAVYAWNNAGVIAYEYNTIMPGGNNLVFKNGDSTRRFVCTFRSDGASVIRRFYKKLDRYTWLPEYGQTNVIGAMTIATVQTISVSSFKPPTSRMINLNGKLTNTTANTTEVKFRIPGTAGDRAAFLGLPFAGQQGNYSFDMYLPSTNVEYDFNAAGLVLNTNLLTDGYVE